MSEEAAVVITEEKASEEAAAAAAGNHPLEEFRLLENPSQFDLRHFIEETMHKISHLERSQHELKEALAMDPEDTDFLNAMSENEIVISKKKDKLTIAVEELKAVDPAFLLDNLYARLIEQRLVIAEIQLQNVVEESIRSNTETVSTTMTTTGAAAAVGNLSVDHDASSCRSGIGITNYPSTIEESDGWL